MYDALAASLLDGLRLCLLVSAGLVLLAAVCAVTLLRGRERSGE